jgi:hypothetical protein
MKREEKRPFGITTFVLGVVTLVFAVALYFFHGHFSPSAKEEEMAFVMLFFLGVVFLVAGISAFHFLFAVFDAVGEGFHLKDSIYAAFGGALTGLGVFLLFHWNLI